MAFFTVIIALPKKPKKFFIGCGIFAFFNPFTIVEIRFLNPFPIVLNELSIAVPKP